MGFFDRFRKNDAAQRLKNYEQLEKNTNAMFSVIRGITDEPMPVQKEKEVDPLGDLYNEVREYLKEKYGIDIDDELLDPTKLYDVSSLDRIAQLKKYYIDHTGFEKSKFPEGTQLLYFDDVFNDLYDNLDAYYRQSDYIGERLERYLKDKGIDRCCIKLGEGEFLYYYPNTVENDAIEYNVSLVDKKNNVKYQLTHEADGQTVDKSAELSQILLSEVAFLDLAHDKEYKDLGDIPVESYTSPKLPLMDKIRIKNEILLDLYESKKFKKDALEVLKDALSKDFDIGYILCPCYSAQQMQTIMQLVKENENEVRMLQDLRLFSTEISKQFHKPFSQSEFAYLISSVIEGNVAGFSTPQQKAQLKLCFYRDESFNNGGGPCMVELGDKRYVITKNEKEHPSFSDFRLEEFIDVSKPYSPENVRTVYECKNATETGSLDEFLSRLEDKYTDKSIVDRIQDAIRDVMGVVTAEEKTGHILLIQSQDGAVIQVEGIRKSSTEEDAVLAAITGNIGEAEVSQGDEGVTITIVKDGVAEVVYSDDASLGVTNSIMQACDIISEHGKLSDSEQRTSTPINPFAEFKLEEEKKNELDKLLYDGKYRPIAATDIDEISKMAAEGNRRRTW